MKTCRFNVFNFFKTTNRVGLCKKKYDGTDAFDTLFIGCEKFPQSQYVSVDAGGVM